LGRQGIDLLSLSEVHKTFKIDINKTLSNPVPQWSSLVKPLPAMSSPPHRAAAPAARIALRTGQAAVSKKTPAGIWIDKIKTNLVSVNQPDQDEMLTHMMDHLNTAADLNTPEIKLEDFNFDQSGSVHHGDDHGQQVNSPDSALDQGHFYEGSADVSKELPGNSAIVDMGYGGYDLVASDFEDRVPLTNDGQPCFVTSSTPSQPIAPMLSSYPTHGNSLSAGPCLTTPDNAATVPLMNQQQSSIPFQIPEDILTMVDEVLLNMDVHEPLLDDDAVTDMDKNIYERAQDSPLHPDLLSNALQQAQLDPSSLVHSDDTSDCHVTVTNFRPDLTLEEICLSEIPSDDRWLSSDQASDNTHIDLNILDGVLASPGSIIHPSSLTTTSTMSTIPVVQNTPTPAPSLPVVATPTKGRLPMKVVLMTPLAGEALRDRPKRNSKKPLRFEEMVMDMEVEQPVASVSHPVTTFTTVSMTDMKVDVGTPMACEGVRDGPKRTSKKPTRLEEMMGDMDSENQASTSRTVTTRAPRVSMGSMTEKEKYHRIRELNNIASRKSREKKKGKIRDLVFEEKVELARKEELTKKYENLKKQRDLMQQLIYKIIAKAKK